MQNLMTGSTGQDVKDVQTMLNSLLPLPPLLVVDGIFGPKTYARVVKFQSENSLSADGIVGPITGRALVEAVVEARVAAWQ